MMGAEDLRRLSADERARLLDRAAEIFDRRDADLGTGAQLTPTGEGELARAFKDDRAKLGRPDIFPLAAEGLTAAQDGVPVTIEELTRAHTYYWLRFPISLWTRPNRGFNRIEFEVRFSGQDGDLPQPVTVDALPSQELINRFQVSTRLALGVGANLRLAVGTPNKMVTLDPGAGELEFGVHAAADVGTKLLFGPVDYSVRTPVVARSGLGLSYVTWRLERDSFVEENDPGIRVILRVARPAAALHVEAEMVATRYQRVLGDGFLRALAALPAGVADFFTHGTPIYAADTWDLSSDLGGEG